MSLNKGIRDDYKSCCQFLKQINNPISEKQITYLVIGESLEQSRHSDNARDDRPAQNNHRVHTKYGFEDVSTHLISKIVKRNRLLEIVV